MDISARQTGWIALIVVALAVGGEWFLAAVYGEDEVRCEQASVVAALPGVPEASGITASRQRSGLLWVINDDPPAVLYGVNDTGEILRKVTVSGASVTDWEDLSTGPCGSGNCIYIADIGDNDERRPAIRLLRVPEPASRAETTATPETFEARYPDKAHDAEAVFVTPDGKIYVVTKEKSGGAVYRFPDLVPGKPLMLERVVVLPIADVTDADASVDGRRVAVRNNEQLVIYRTSELLNGDVEHGAAIPLTRYNEPQGEAVTFAGRDSVFLAGEGGRKDVPGTLVQLQCVFPSAS